MVKWCKFNKTVFRLRFHVDIKLYLELLTIHLFDRVKTCSLVCNLSGLKIIIDRIVTFLDDFFF